jgi:TolA-binding protein
MTAVIMKRRLRLLSAFTVLFVVLPLTSALALDEADRLWLVGEHAFADGLYPLARRTLEKLVDQFPTNAHLPDAVLLLGRSRLAVGDAEAALEAFRRAGALQPPPGTPGEPKFWEAEALFRLKRYADARAAYDAVVRGDAAAPLAPDALYGYAWSELELHRTEPAVKALRDFLASWPGHPLAASASYQLARALVDQKRYADALAILQPYATKYPGAKTAAEAHYLLGWTKIAAKDYRSGVADLRAFIEAHPTHDLAPAARRLVTQTLARYGDRQELQEAYTTLLAQTPATAEALYDAASIAGRLGRAKDQETVWRKLRAQFPEHALGRRAALELGNAAFKRKDYKEASAQAQAAAPSDEDAVRAEAWLLAGESDLKLKRYAAAEKAFKEVGQVTTAEAAVRYRALAGLGLAHEEQKEWREAFAAYEAVASKSPDGTLRDWARERARAVRAHLPKSEGTATEKKAPAPKPAAAKPAPRTGGGS